MPEGDSGERRPPRPHWAARVAPYLLIGFLYLATSPFHNGLNNPNEMVRVYMTRALVETGEMNIDSVVRDWGGVDDKAIREGKLYSSKAPLQSLVGAPAYAMLAPSQGEPRPAKRTVTVWLRIFGSALPGFLFAAALLAWARRRAVELNVPRIRGTAIGLTLGLGTMLYPYAITYTGHIWAALGAGSCYLATIVMSREESGSPSWRRAAIIAGFFGGATPFAEYPAALMAAPALAGAFLTAGPIKRKLETIGWFALGGALPFGLGLWSHYRLWGSPIATGYSFLENTAYVQVHGSGFFGVGPPKLEAFGGTMFSPGTGLFFFSPVLLIGLVALIQRLATRTDRSGSRLPIVAAITALIGFTLEVLFISGHSGWRGGWTVGPRYIIAVAPILGIWVIEALPTRGLRALIGPLGAVSIAATGFAAALYPHLSDVYTNPLVTFLWPSYLRGEFSYGMAHSLGITGAAANIVHILPLLAAMLFVGLAGATSLVRGAAHVALAVVLFFGGISFIPERDVTAALKENERLWGFWEPPRPRAYEPGLLFRARDKHRRVHVEAQLLPDGRTVRCRWNNDKCSYGGMVWQHYGPDFLAFNGKHEPILFLHPISGWAVRAKIGAVRTAKRGVVRFGFTDASADSDNPTPVRLRLTQGDTVLFDHEMPPKRGLQTLDFQLSNDLTPLVLQFESERDGARVLGFDVDLFSDEPP